MIEIKSAESLPELEGILELQLENHHHTVSESEKSEQGFVTVRHSLDQKMNSIAKHIIAKDGEQVVGYILAMTKASKDLVPLLIPMFTQFDLLTFKNHGVAAYDYMVIGQICVSKDYRGKGLIDQMYQAYKKAFSQQFDFAITEIAKNNVRSIAAHHRIGFSVIHEFKDDIQDWAIVVWDWK
jgi:ribosomal protein S18 acetylase RimI-like enzyme